MGDTDQMTESEQPSRKLIPINYETAVHRAIRLKCPRCGEGALFQKWLSMHKRCSHCGLMYERGPGYFLGSTYVNYGFVALTMTVMYIGLHFGAEISNTILTPPLVAYCVVVPLLLFRHARSWWLAMDCYFDPVNFDPDNDAMMDEYSSRNGQV